METMDRAAAKNQTLQAAFPVRATTNRHATQLKAEVSEGEKLQFSSVL